MIAPEPFFEPRGTPFSEFYRIRALTELGHQVDLVTYSVGEDVDIALDIPNRVVSGTITITNSASIAATGVSVSDTVSTAIAATAKRFAMPNHRTRGWLDVNGAPHVATT